uniref:Chromosome 7 open reading frame 50 n=2 Tax=Nothobranchius pienaari TaxID=704102 RepID=A0A1A8LW48_9TELE
MAKEKDKMVKSKSKSSEKKKLNSHDIKVLSEDLMETKVTKKRKCVEVEELPAQNISVTSSPSEQKPKKGQKKKMTEETPTSPTEYPDPSSCPKLTCEPEGAQDLSPEERRVLERKMKKIRKKEEKKRLKKEGQTALKTQDAGPSASKQAQDYLTCWAENRSAWKFQKIRQTWLLQHMFDSEKVSDEKFPVLLQYLEGLCGGSKDTTVQKALSLVEESGKAPDDAVVQQRAHRAREVIQLLS